MNRRNWIRTAGLSGSLAFLGMPTLTRAEIDAFHPRPLKGPVRLTSNENPYGPSEKVREAIKNSFSYACRYPYQYLGEITEILAKKEGLTPDHIVVTVGSTEGLRITGLTFGVGKGEIIAARPTFLAMMSYAEQWGASINWVPVRQDMQHDLKEMEKRISFKTRLVFICNPNNPTSTLLPAKQLKDFCETASKKTIVFSDEAYYDYIEESNYPSMVELVKQDKNVIVSRTFSKVYGMAGLRIGYLIAKPEIASKIRQNLGAVGNIPAIEGAKMALKDKEFYDFSLQKNRESKSVITRTLDELNLEYVKSHTNFVFFKTGRDITIFQEQMKNEGVLVGRPFPPFTNWCRISTGTLEEVKAFRKAIKLVMA